MVTLILGWLLSTGFATAPLPTPLPPSTRSRASHRRRTARRSRSHCRNALRARIRRRRRRHAPRVHRLQPAVDRAAPVGLRPGAATGCCSRKSSRTAAARGENLAKVFSNASGSHASSLGLFLTRETYQGATATRCAWKASSPASTTPRWSARSSCTARRTSTRTRLRSRAASAAASAAPRCARRSRRGMIDVLKGGQFVFAYYPDADVAGPY